MDHARTYPCPSCGGNVREEARRCPFCEAPVATVRCSACFHMNVTGVLHCGGCGRDLGLEPVAEDDAMRCPRCDVPMHRLREDAGVLRDCGNCGGQLVEHALLRKMLERCAVLADASPRPRVPAPMEARVHYVPCPACKALMSRKNFGENSGVIVDVCARHGTWFDAGELPRVLAFAEAGGLERARKREAEEKEKAAARAHAAIVHEAIAEERRHPPLDRLDAGDAIADLLAFLGDLLTPGARR